MSPKAPGRGYVVVTSTSDELVYLTVGEHHYIYSLEKVFHEEFFKKMKYTPGKALAFIRNKALWCERE